MTAKVVDFKRAKLRIAIQKFEETGIIAKYLLKDDMYKKAVGISTTGKYIEQIIEAHKIQSYIDLQAEFSRDLKSLESNLKTNSSKFKFPTILCNYRKGINPVVALYHNVQEALFKYDPKNKKYVWIINLFLNKRWLTELLSAINTDIKSINTIIKKYNSNRDSTYINAKLNELLDKKKNLTHYAEVFVLVEEWKKDS
jgi:hypothetical protein